MVNFDTDPDHEALRAGLRELLTRFDDEYWARCDCEHRFPTEFYDALAAGGWLGVAIPADYGGAGLGVTEAALLLQEIAASGAAMNGCSAIHLTIFGMNPWSNTALRSYAARCSPSRRRGFARVLRGHRARCGQRHFPDHHAGSSRRR